MVNTMAEGDKNGTTNLSPDEKMKLLKKKSPGTLILNMRTYFCSSKYHSYLLGVIP